ncbi:hypothetical protein BDY19DRAFT_909166 [Irpex rosettiformis]|uniref:Uncharacterized protein n=1 Tax=Irpex rosettiformis TaxID=378272 RepID=A0ACB8TTR9_9APHY|nr:hypothetical protein BDY19DRAFT_909166 [Irpex rosettiformis]
MCVDGSALVSCQRLPARFHGTLQGGVVTHVLVEADLANRDDLDFASFLSSLISTAVKFPHWTNTSDGIVIEGSESENSAESEDEATIALKDLASIPGTNQYSPRWEGPPPTDLLPWGQLAAIDVLVSAVGLTGTSNSSVMFSTAPSSR